MKKSVKSSSVATLYSRVKALEYEIKREKKLNRKYGATIRELTRRIEDLEEFAVNAVELYPDVEDEYDSDNYYEDDDIWDYNDYCEDDDDDYDEDLIEYERRRI